MEVSTNSSQQTLNMYDYMNSFIMTPGVFIVVFIIILLYFMLFASLGNSSSSEQSMGMGETATSSSGSMNMLWILGISLLIVLFIINFFQYVFGYDVVASVKNLFKGAPEVDLIVDQTSGSLISPGGVETTVPEIPFVEEVFNIPGNYYGYNDAKAVCSAYGARLATYSEVEKSYEHGGEWCNYGWSDGQMALFPTQQKTFDNLQKIKGHEHDCGRPGINGGYIANEHVKFGVNCYGHKPEITREEQDLMETMKPYPETMKDIELEKRVDYWKNHIQDILVSPFNHNSWSRF